MIKKIQEYFRKLTLTQQVVSIILVMVVFLLLFFIFFLSDSISHTISTQIYDMLEARQQPVVKALSLNQPPKEDFELWTYLSSDANTCSLLVTEEDVEIISTPSEGRPQAFVERVVHEARELLMDNIPSLETTIVDNGKLYYCLFTKAISHDKPGMVVSFMDDSYAQEIRTTLMDSTVYVTVLVFLLLLLIFLLWVFSIIHPLNQIKTYISQIKEGKDVDLYINREDEIGEVAQELRTLTAELAKQEKAKEEMIHNISHDLKTPIATIKSYSESIKDGIYPYGDLESSVDVILDNANRLEEKVHSLLYMNRIEYLVSSDAEGVTTNMKDVVEEVVLNAKVIRPEIELITDVEEVYFDGLFESWRVCVENILQNAFRYAKSYIKIEVHDNELRISNDGPKMQEDRIDSLFKPYIMGEGGKFGLGLSIVSKVVQANHYKVKGLNTKDGVCFRIYRDVVKKPSNNRFKNGGLNVSHWKSIGKNNDDNKTLENHEESHFLRHKQKEADKKEKEESEKRKDKEGGQRDSLQGQENANRSRRRRKKANPKPKVEPQPSNEESQTTKKFSVEDLADAIWREAQRQQQQAQTQGNSANQSSSTPTRASTQASFQSKSSQESFSSQETDS